MGIQSATLRVALGEAEAPTWTPRETSATFSPTTTDGPEARRRGRQKTLSEQQIRDRYITPAIAAAG